MQNRLTNSQRYLGLVGLVELVELRLPLTSSSSSVIMGEGRASLPTSQLYTWIVRWKVIT